MSGKLSAKQMAFCREYIVDHNATQAAIRAGYSEKTARQQASRLLSNVAVQDEIQRLTVDAVGRNEVDVDRILQEMICNAYLDPIVMFDDEGNFKPLKDIPEHARRAIAGIKIKRTWEGGRGGEDEDPDYIEIVDVKIIDKQGTLRDLGKYKQMYYDRKEIKHSGRVENWHKLDDIREYRAEGQE